MFHLIDAGLRQALVRGIPGLTANDVGFDPPNADWRQRVGVAGRLLINAYLIEFRENRRLRRTEPVRGFAGGSITETPAPYRVDCHYLVSAWSPAAFGQAVEPTIDEHQLLGDIVTSLDRADPFVFARFSRACHCPRARRPNSSSMNCRSPCCQSRAFPSSSSSGGPWATRRRPNPLST